MNQPSPEIAAMALLRLLSTPEVEDAYRVACQDESEKGQESAHLIRCELIRRHVQPNWRDE